MTERAITAGGALLALLIVYTLFFGGGGEPPVTRPVTTEAGRNGYRAVDTWLRREGISVTSLRERYTRLLDEDALFAAGGNVLITTMPHARPMRVGEVQVLERWIRNGNTLLVMAALDDTPEWSVAPFSDTGGFLSQLERITGLRFEPLRDGDGAAQRPAVPPETAVELTPAGAHPLMDGIERLRGYSDEASALWSASAADPESPLLRLAVETLSGSSAIWQTARGEGQVIVVASGSLLSNHAIATADAGRFLANVLRYHSAGDGAVIFDDMHQGLSVLYDPAAFFSDSRLHATILLLIALWLAYVLGSSNRLAPPTADRAEPRQGDFLRAAGGLMARRLDRRDAGLLLLDEWFEEVRRTRGLAPGAEPPWRALQATPALGSRTYAELRRCHERLTSGRRVDLTLLHNTLQQARQAIG